MTNQPGVKQPVESKSFYVKKLTKSGATRYLSVGAMFPKDWSIVKVTVERLDKGVCILRVEPIK